MLISTKSRVHAIQHSKPGENQTVMQEASGRRRERGWRRRRKQDKGRGRSPTWMGDLVLVDFSEKHFFPSWIFII